MSMSEYYDTSTKHKCNICGEEFKTLTFLKEKVEHYLIAEPVIIGKKGIRHISCKGGE